jgi:hypothetical protein
MQVAYRLYREFARTLTVRERTQNLCSQPHIGCCRLRAIGFVGSQDPVTPQRSLRTGLAVERPVRTSASTYQWNCAWNSAPLSCLHRIRCSDDRASGSCERAPSSRHPARSEVVLLPQIQDLAHHLAWSAVREMPKCRQDFTFRYHPRTIRSRMGRGPLIGLRNIRSIASSAANGTHVSDAIGFPLHD